MRKIATWSIALAVLLAHSVSSAADGDGAGSLVIIGGAARFNDPTIWTRIVELAGGERPKIAVLPTASGHPLKSGGRIIDAINRYGGDAFLVPLAHKDVDADYRQVAADSQWVDRIKAAHGVFLTGGEQGRIVQALQASDGSQTPMLAAIWDVYRHGGVIAGTSAGAAVMSQLMFCDAKPTLAMLSDGVTMGKEIGPGLGFIDHAWFIDQHCLVRGRFARALLAMQAQKLSFGLGIDEDSALVVARDVVQVIGYKGAIVLDLSQATHDDQLKSFNVKNVRLTYLDHGDAINLRTLAVTPSSEKLRDLKIDPAASDFHPYYDEPPFSNDILGNGALVELMCKLIDNKHHEAIGLAFNGSLARERSVPAFEFRFYRGGDSVGWNTEAFGSDDYTVANIHLDVRSIEVAGPLYK